MAHFKTYKFNRTLQETDIDGPVITTTNNLKAGMIVNKLSYLPSVAEFNILFEQYKITGVKHKFFPPAPLDDGLNRGQFYYRVDFNDATIPSNPQANIFQHTDFKVKDMNNAKPFSVFYKPMVSQPVYIDATAQAYSTVRKQPWIDLGTNSNQTSWYGFKWLWQGNESETVPTMKVISTYYFKCRGVS